MGTSQAKPGDVVELKDKESGFTDPDTLFDISRDQQKELGGTIGDRTHQAIASGGLIIVTGSKAKKSKEDDGGSKSKADEAGFPKDFPSRDALARAGVTFEALKTVGFDNKEALTAINGIGEKTADAIAEWGSRQ